MDVVICPECQMRMIPRPDGTCPSCHAVVCLEIAERAEPVASDDQPTDAPREESARRETAFELPEAPQFPDLPADLPPTLADLARELGQDAAPRQLPARFKRKTLGSRLLPGRTSLQLARGLGYLLGGISTVAGFALMLSGRLADVPHGRTAGALAIAFGGFLIAMAKRQA